jgi:(2Fe-2S) ferredoxin/small nuclear ribonucleoprotein (snRNP)-like protein
MAEEAGKALGIALKTEETDAEMLAKLDPLTDTKFGLARVEMGSKKCLAGTVKKYDTHLFVLWKKATEWPKNVEDGEKGSTALTLPQALHAALKKHAKGIRTGKAKLNVAECSEEEGDEEGTLLLFPQEVCVTGVTIENADAVVEALLVRGEEEEEGEDGGDGGGLGERVAEARDRLEGIEGVGVKDRMPRKHLFVCCHLKRDKRCGLVGPFLIKEFQRLIRAQEGREEENSDVFEFECPVRACSHVGGHAYAGNVITFSRRVKEGGREGGTGGRVVGDWWGYVTPVVAREIVVRHLVKGELLEGVWRGQMGLGEEEQKRVALKEGRCEGCDCGGKKTEL